MIVFLNGEFVPEDRAVVSVFDRSFLYGDGLFETMLVHRGKPFLWTQHMDRLRSGADFLGIKIPFGCKALEKFAAELIVQNKMPDALLRLTLSRGVGVRGYSPKGADKPVLMMSLHPLSPAGTGAKWKLVTSSFRLPANEPLAQFKTCNKLPQVLARAEADAAGADEALLVNTDGFVVEASSSNLFWVQGRTVCTPPLSGGILAGVTRGLVLELCPALGLETRECNITTPQLKHADGVFLSLSSLGIVEADSLDGEPVAQSPVTKQLDAAYQEMVAKE